MLRTAGSTISRFSTSGHPEALEIRLHGDLVLTMVKLPFTSKGCLDKARHKISFAIMRYNKITTIFRACAEPRTAQRTQK